MEKNIHQLFPFPENGGLVEETPPTFCFVKEERGNGLILF